jgi:hypothetical protein
LFVLPLLGRGSRRDRNNNVQVRIDSWHHVRRWARFVASRDSREGV